MACGGGSGNATNWYNDLDAVRKLVLQDTFCPGCHRAFDSAKKRRMTDATCGHDACYSCLFNVDGCPVCPARDPPQPEPRSRPAIRTNGHLTTFMQVRGLDPLLASPTPSRRRNLRTPTVVLSPSELGVTAEEEALLGPPARNGRASPHDRHRLGLLLDEIPDSSPISTLTNSSDVTKRNSSREDSGDSVSSLLTASSGSGSGFRRYGPLHLSSDCFPPPPKKTGSKLPGSKRLNFTPPIPKNAKIKLQSMDFDVTSSESFPLFVGRHWVFKEIDKVINCSDNRGICIAGGPGTGKTSILLQLLDNSTFSRNDYQELDIEEAIYHSGPQGLLRVLGSQLAGHHFCRMDNAPTCLIPDFVHSIAAQLARCPLLVSYKNILLRNPNLQEALNLESCIRNPSVAFVTGVLNPLRKIGRIQTNLYIAIDALDEAQLHAIDNDKALASFLAEHYDQFPKWLKVVVTVRASSKEIVQNLPIVDLSDAAHSERVRDDMHCYISHRLSTSASIRRNIIIHEGSHARFTSYLANLSKGCMLYVRCTLDLVEQGYLIVKSSSFRVLPVNLAEVYQLVFNLRFNTNSAFHRIQPILKICLAATVPLTETELYYTVRSGCVEGGIDWQDFQTNINTLTADNLILAVRRDGRFQFPHHSLREWLQRREPSSSCTKFLCDIRDGHALIAFRMSRWENPLPADRLLDFAHHILKAHLYKSIDREMLPVANAAELQAYWIQRSSRQVKPALANIRNLYSPNIWISRLLLLAGADPNYRTPEGSLLVVAAGRGHTEMVLSLLDFGAVLENAALSAACLNGHLDIVQKLLYWRPRPRNAPPLPPIDHSTPPRQVHLINQMDTSRRCPIVYAAMGGHFNILSYLFDLEWPTEGSPLQEVAHRALVEAAAYGHIEICMYLLDKCRMNSDLALASASSGGYMQLFHELIARGARPGPEACHGAARRGHTEILEKLIRLLGVDLLDDEGRTPLMSAAIGDQPSAIDLLLNNGADIAAEDLHGRTAISWAACHGSYNAAYSLILQGALVNHTDHEGCIPLDLAALSGSVETVHVLLEGGAVVEHTDSTGVRPLDRAIRTSNAQIVAMLLSHGATIGSQTWKEAETRDVILQLLLKKLLDDGIQLCKKGRIKVAVQRFSYGLKKFPQKSNVDLLTLRYQYYVHLSRSKRKIGNLEGAIEAADQAISLSPQSYEGYLQRARATREAGRANEALKDVREARRYVDPGTELFRSLSRLHEEIATEEWRACRAAKAGRLHQELSELCILEDEDY